MEDDKKLPALPAGRATVPPVDKPETKPNPGAQNVAPAQADQAAQSQVQQLPEPPKPDTGKETLMAGINEVLGVHEEERLAEPSAVVKLLKDRYTALETELNDLRVKTAIDSAAQKHNADVDLLEPYLRGTNLLSNIDPKEPGYADKVSEVVKGLVAGNPKFLARTVPVASGIDTSTGKQGKESRIITLGDLDDMSPEEIYDAQKKGLLKGLFG